MAGAGAGPGHDIGLASSRGRPRGPDRGESDFLAVVIGHRPALTL